MSDIVKCVCQHCQRVTVVPQETIRQALSEAEQREKDARSKALELAAVHAECAADDRPGRDRNFDWNDGYIDGCRGAASAIRALKDEVR